MLAITDLEVNGEFPAGAPASTSGVTGDQESAKCRGCLFRYFRPGTADSTTIKIKEVKHFS